MNPFKTTFEQLHNQPCWGMNYDSQLNLSMSFGKPIMRCRNPSITKSKSRLLREMASYRNITVKGVWWLWIFCAYWKITLRDSYTVTGSSSSRRMNMAMQRLSGQKLINVHINTLTGATSFDFDLGGNLKVRRFESDSNEELWLLYKPKGYVLTVRGDGHYSHALGSINPKQEKWHTISKWVKNHSKSSIPCLTIPIGTYLPAV